MSREQYVSDELLNRVAFVFRSKQDGIRVIGFPEAKVYEDSSQWEHLATLDSFRWIECLFRNSPKERNKQIKDVLQ